MKHLVVFLVIFILACFALPNFEFAKKTRHGETLENFKPLTSSVLTYVLARYLATNYVKFEIYGIPNYVQDLFKYNRDFSSVYKVKPKFTLILIEPNESKSIEGINFTAFHDKLRHELTQYPKDFNIIYRNRNTPVDYPDPYDKFAAKSLLEHCKNFCLIDPSRNTVFILKRLSITETAAIPVLLQEYHSLLK